jgi:ATP-dependent Lon protease
MNTTALDLEALHPAHASAREELLDFLVTPEINTAAPDDDASAFDTPFLERRTRRIAPRPALRQVMLHGPAGIGKHHLSESLQHLAPPGEVHVRDVGATAFLPESGMVIWISRSPTPPADAPHRMPRIAMHGFSMLEKRKLAWTHLIPDICGHFALDAKEFLREEILDITLSGGMRESGWHGFVDRLSRLCRRRAREIQEVSDFPIDLFWAHRILGVDALPADTLDVDLPIGCVHAMMVSSWGGDIARVEALHLPGKGRLAVTGAGPQAEMAARVARSRLSALCRELGVTLEALRELDWHIHISGPSGPKDGSSLGWPILVAMASALTRNPVGASNAFTGELSLSGSILSVGGIVEKALGAARAGCLNISVPQPDAMCMRAIDTNQLGANLWFVAQDLPALSELGLQA